jgi:hypothetical protein
VHVQPQRALEQFLRNQRAVGDGDHDVDAGIAELRGALGLPHLDLELLGDLLRRRSADLSAASLRPVGTSQ